MKLYKHSCPRCSKVTEYGIYTSYYNAKTRNSVCKSCRTAKANKSPSRNTRMENNPSWKGYNEIPYGWFSKYFERQGRKKEGSVSIEDIHRLWVSQDKLCVLSSMPVDFIKRENGISCSIDRIDSKCGYHIENIQLVHKDVNLMKNHFNQEYFISVCNMIATKHGKSL